MPNDENNEYRASDLLQRIRSNISDGQSDNDRTQSDATSSEELRSQIRRQKAKAKKKTITTAEFYNFTPVDKVTEEDLKKMREASERKHTFARKANEKTNNSRSMSDEDYNLMSIFGMEQTESEVVEEPDEEDNFDTVYDDDVPFAGFLKETKEFHDESQFETIQSGNKKTLVHGLLSLLAYVILVAFALILELEPFEALPGFFKPSVYPNVAVWLEIQMMVIAVVLQFKRWIKGAVSLFTAKPTSDSVFFLIITSSLSYDIVMLAVSASSPRFFGTVTLVACLCACLSGVLDTVREIMSLRIVADKHDKYAFFKMKRSEAKLETDRLSAYLPDDNKFLAVAKTKKIEKFYKNHNAPNDSDRYVRLIIALAIVEALVFGIYGFLKQGGISAGLEIAYITFIMAAPFAIFFVRQFPMFKLAVGAFGDDCAVIGTSAIYRYTAPATVTFNDSDVFDINNVRLKSVRCYSNDDMYRVLKYVGALFCPTDGLLGKMLGTILEGTEITDDMEYLTISDDGIEAVVEGRHVLVGSYHYIMRNRLIIPNDNDKDEINDVSMYLSVDSKVLAKLRIEYVPNKSFVKIAKKLFDSGITVVVRTFDPNVDLALLCNTMGFDENQPIQVIHTGQEVDLYSTKESVDSSIVSLDGLRGLSDTMYRCNRTRNVISICMALAAISAIIGALAMGVIISLGGLSSIGPMHPLLLQLFWTLPSIIIAALFS